jgi:hypothetical protein
VGVHRNSLPTLSEEGLLRDHRSDSPQQASQDGVLTRREVHDGAIDQYGASLHDELALFVAQLPTAL